MSQQHRKIDQRCSLVMSDLLRAELTGTPIDWARYCADKPRRRASLEQLNQDRFIHMIGNNRWALTFNGFVLLNTPESRNLMAICHLVYGVLRAHYKEELFAPIVVAEIARRLSPKTDVEKVKHAVEMLTREGGIGLGIDGRPISAASKVSGNQDLLEKSFAVRVRKLREVLNKPRFESVAFENPLVAFHAPQWNSFPGQQKSMLEELGSQEVKEAWQKCLERSGNDLAGSITAARSLIESVCKQILVQRQIEFPPAATLPVLFASVRREVALDPARESNRTLKEVLGGCASVINGLAELRNALGDSHGKAPGSVSPSHRQAKLAVSLAVAMSEFLIGVDDARKSL